MKLVVPGTNTESKLSLSADSIDGEGVPFIDRHRAISKSILKKSESSNNYYNTGDSDTEKLITDNASTVSVCDNETSATTGAAFDGTKARQQPVSPLLSRQVLESIFRTNNNVEREDEAADQSDERSYASKITRSIFDDVLEGTFVSLFLAPHSTGRCPLGELLFRDWRCAACAGGEIVPMFFHFSYWNRIGVG